MLQDWLSPQLFNQENLQNLRRQFANAKPFPHIVVNNFLQENKATKLLEVIKKEEFIEKESDLFKFKQTHDFHFSKNKTIKQFHSECLNWEFFNLISQITNSKFKGTLDMSSSLYESTSFLLPHDDKLEGRKIAYILYLSKNFKKEDGGSFTLYNTKKEKNNFIPTTAAKKYLPLWNSLLLFEVSPISFHEVEENFSEKSRYTIGGWLH